MFVTVIIAAYNAEHYIQQAIESVLGQTHANFELIVVDDGSTDGTAGIVQKLGARDPRVRVLTQTNQGAGTARNAAIAEARSDWIAIMDADDVMEPHRLERQIAFVQVNPDLAIASCLVTWINWEGRPMGRSRSNLTTDVAVRSVLDREELLVFCHPGCLIRRDMLVTIGGYRNEFWPSEDIDLFSRVADAGGRILVQPEYLMRYRVHPDSGTGRTSDWDNTLHEWIQRCSLSRRGGVPEPTLTEFMERQRQRTLLHRLNRRRRDLGKILYNKATFTYSIGHVLTAVLLVTGSTLLNPIDAPRKVWQNYLRARLLSRFLASGDDGHPRISTYS